MAGAMWAQAHGQAAGQQPAHLQARPGLLATRLQPGSQQQGYVVQLFDGYGFIRYHDAADDVFFRKNDVAGEVYMGDIVSFTVEDPIPARNPQLAYKQMAKKVTLVQRAEQLEYVVSEEWYSGVVSRPCQTGHDGTEDQDTGRISYLAPNVVARQTLSYRLEDCTVPATALPFGALVSFRLSHQPGNCVARPVQITLKESKREYGFIRSLNKKSRSGFILGMNGKSNTYFPFSQVRQLVDADRGTSPDAVGLKPGVGVSYTLDEHGYGNKVCAVAVEVLPPGTLVTEQTLPGRFIGRVCRVPVPAGQLAGVPVDRRNPTRGVLEYTDGASFQKIDFETSQVDGEEPFAENDEVEFTKQHNLPTDTWLAVNLRPVSRAQTPRELGQIRLLKNNFGFINCCERHEDLIFNFAELADADIAVGDDVEFTVTGRKPNQSAVRIKKMPKGTAKFEELLDETHLGFVRTAAGMGDGFKSGVVEYIDNAGAKKTLVFSPDDVVNDGCRVMRGDVVEFRITINGLQVKAAQAQGGHVAQYAGRRATQLTAFRIPGKFKHWKGANGCVEYDPPPKLEALRGDLLCILNRPAAPSPSPAAAPPENSAAKDGPAPPADEGDGLSRGEPFHAAPDRGGDLGAKGGEPGPRALPPKAAPRRKARAFFKAAELDPAAPQLRVGDPLTFVLVTKRADQEGGVDRIARYVRPVGWVPPFAPPPAQAHAFPQGQWGGHAMGGAYGYPPQYPQGPDAGYGGGYYQGIDGYGGEYYGAEQGYAGVNGGMNGVQQPGVDWRMQPQQGRGAGRGNGRARANGHLPHQASPGVGGAGEEGGPGRDGTPPPNNRAAKKAARQQRKNDAARAESPDPYLMVQNEPAPKFFLGMPQQGKMKERFVKAPKDREDKGFVEGWAPTVGPLTPALLLQYWKVRPLWTPAPESE